MPSSASGDGAVAPTRCCSHLAREGLSKFDMPEYFTVLDAFPLTASGKILKRELVEWMKSGRMQPEPVRLPRAEGNT